MSTIINTIRLLIVIFVLSPALYGSAQANSDEEDIKTLLEARDAEIKKMIAGDLSDNVREELRLVVNGIIDFEQMSADALGKHWSDLTSDDRARFTEVFSEIVRHQSLQNLDIYRAKVTYNEILVEDGTATVSTSTLYKEVPAEVVYRMSKATGAWKITDIVLDEVSTAEGYARSFQSVVRKKGFGALMTSLEKKRAKLG